MPLWVYVIGVGLVATIAVYALIAVLAITAVAVVLMLIAAAFPGPRRVRAARRAARRRG
jgi:hypothetical protein